MNSQYNEIEFLLPAPQPSFLPHSQGRLNCGVAFKGVSAGFACMWSVPRT